MRVTSNSFPSALQYQLESLATKQARLQSQAATGQRFSAPSEDPRATRKVLELQQETRRLSQYNENIDLSSEKLNSVYGAIQAVKKVSDRAGELAAMVDDMKSRDQLAAYRQEINQLIEQSVQIANTNNQFGYIFRGRNPTPRLMALPGTRMGKSLRSSTKDQPIHLELKLPRVHRFRLRCLVRIPLNQERRAYSKPEKVASFRT